MKHFKIFNLLLIAILFFYTSSCDQQESLEPMPIKQVVAVTVTDSYESFAKILATAMEDTPELRVFIKKEALKQFDKDFDVLVGAVLHKEVVGSATFYELLKTHDSEDMLDQILSNLPLITIFVPDLPRFSPKTWDALNDDSPFVAVKHKSEGIIKYFAKEGEFEDEEKFIPAFPVVVIKTNERVVLDKGQYDNQLTLGANVENSDNLNLRFLGEEFDGSVVKDKNHLARTTRFVDNKIVDSFRKAKDNNCVCPQRDYIYYDIFEPEGANQGAFDSRYGEAITAFTFENVAGIENATDGWTEGNLELHIRAFFIGGSSTLSSLKKVVNVPANEVQTITTQERCSLKGIWPFRRRVCSDVIIDRKTKRYTFDDPIDLVTWRMDEYGSKIKYNIFEFDPSATYEKTVTHSTVKSANFKIDAATGVKVKVGAEFGASITNTVSNSTKVTYTLGSDDLGEAVLDWTDPVITSSRIRRPFPLFKEREYFDMYTISTGSVILSCETVKK